MKGATERDERFTRYLLGDLPEEERVRLEEEYFTDDAAFESLLAARDELVDLHARGELKGRTRERFEQHFLSTEARRRRAREAKELIEFSTRIAAAETADERARQVSRRASLRHALGVRTPALRFAFAALLICVVLGGAWLLFRRADVGPAERAAVTPPPTPEIASQPQTGDENRPRPEDDKAGTGTTPPTSPAPRRAQAPDANLNRAPARPAAQARGTARVASILLTPLLTRDAAQSNTLLIRPDTTTARLQLSFRGGDYRRYVVVLRTIDGAQVWRGRAVKARTPDAVPTAVISVPARVFRRQDHTVTLYGVTAGGESRELSEYFFTVRRGENQ